MPGTHWTFPRTMTRGKFAGRTFESQTEYQKAVRAKASKPRRRRKLEDIPPLLRESNATSVRKILETYEELRAAGLGPAKATKLVERLSAAGTKKPPGSLLSGTPGGFRAFRARRATESDAGPSRGLRTGRPDYVAEEGS